ncbi:flagellar protein FlgN [Gilvimarinus agarilyticus]|uniref:flagella synthesis protein FlgN n=1 Tax=Gilvimarinus sp. 2_MG-2023 TaxID=3062666 RepID=UPI001C080603|nr:flagellar protein FlgN [Gilvimarinus sp. 2_MG-2023]MBU2887265.1 flagellar protein FlgN [Gilvimarinus agarilyticus]MDO6571924.1 flagellar protein FlgN [Gilvimarinus sp. 2_MG-2023]
MSVNPSLVSQMLDNDLAAAKALLELLQRETELLKNRQHTELESTLSVKAEHLNVLDAHARERTSLLLSLGLANDSDGWLEYMQSTPSLTPLITKWQEIQSVITQCNQQNTKNGKLINRSQQTLSRILDLVKGKSAGDNLYNAKGVTTRSVNSGNAVKA